MKLTGLPRVQPKSAVHPPQPDPTPFSLLLIDWYKEKGKPEGWKYCISQEGVIITKIENMRKIWALKLFFSDYINDLKEY